MNGTGSHNLRSRSSKLPIQSAENEDSQVAVPIKLKNSTSHLTFPAHAFWRVQSALLVVIVSIIAFSNSIEGNFVFDDSEAILNNKDVLPDTPISNLIFNDFWGLSLTHNKSHKSYRPLTVLTFRWNYWMAGGFDQVSFHLTNVIIHAIASVLVIPVVERFFEGKSPQMSVLVALLFASHPVHTEAVAGIVGRADLLSAFFSFLSFLVYAIVAERNDEVVSVKTVSLLFLSMVLCLLALFSKEQGITILGICSAYDLLIVHKIEPLSKLTSAFSRGGKCCAHTVKAKPSIASDNVSSQCPLQKKNVSKTSRKALFFRHAVLIVSGFALLLARWRIMGSKAPVFQDVDNPASFADSFLTRVWSYNYIYALNAWLMICPEWLCFDWSMGCVPLISTIFDIRLLSVAAFYCALFGLIFQGLFTLQTYVGRSIMMALVVIILPFLPASNLFFNVGFVLAERVLYVSTLGMCMLVVIGMEIILKHMPDMRWLLICGYSGLLMLYCVRSIHRNGQWHNEKVLFRSCLSVCPQNAKVHYNVAKNAGDLGDRKLAIKEYEIALELNPNYAQAMNNLANILRDEGETYEAEALLRRALSIKADFPAAWMNLGIVLAGNKQYREAEQSYHRALAHRSFYPDCFYNLGNLYLDQRMYMEAYEAWRNATQQRPTFSLAWNNMVIMLENLGNAEEAKAVAVEALSILPNDPGLHFNLGNLLGKLGQFDEAELHFKKAIEFDPLNPVYHSNMGVLYHRWKKYALAEEKYKAALKLNPFLKSAITNLDMLKRAM